MKRRIVAALLALALGVVVVPVTLAQQPALAAPASGSTPTMRDAVSSQFNAGMIISDAMFYDGGAMSIEGVQNFLSAQVRTCQAGYTCLKDYHQDTTNKAAVAGRCAAYLGLANESAAQIIARVGAACGISQKTLIVLLEKEEGLVTSTAPSAGRYKIATGYGCPDTAACDTTYYGFFNQVWMASLQFKTYLTSASSFNVQAGRANNIRFSPNASCGASSVYVQNAATAGLYNYTPYQPNAAALANLYGVGDGCSSYGNRNFWRLFTDWFGSTTATSMLRTAANPTVYVVVGTTKYPVNSYATYNAFSPLGPASIVSQTYLDTLTTGQPLGRIVRGSDGAIYFVDAAIKTQFTSCAMVVDYGGSCDPTGYINMTDAQIASLHTGPYVTAVLGTQEGPRYYLQAGSKREVLDDASLTAASIPLAFNVLTESSLDDRPFGAPVVRDSAFVAQSETGAQFFLSGGKKYSVATTDSAVLGLPAHDAGKLHSASLALVPAAPSGFTGAVTLPGSSVVQVLTAAGRYTIGVAALASAESPLPADQALLSSYPDLGTLAPGSFVKSPTSDAVYVVTSTSLRQVGGWAALVAISGTPNPTIVVLPTGVVDAMPKGPGALAPGTMYRTVDNAQIYLIDGLGTKLPVRSFDYTSAAGFTAWTYAPSSSIDGYTSSAAALTYGIQCGATQYVSVGGQLRSLTTATAPLFPFTFVTFDPITCALTVKGAPAIDFIRTSDGAIFQLAGGQKHHVSAATLTTLNAGKGWMSVPLSFAALIPTGPNV